MRNQELSELLMGIGGLGLFLMSFKVLATWETEGTLELGYILVPLLSLGLGWLLSRSYSEQD